MKENWKKFPLEIGHRRAHFKKSKWEKAQTLSCSNDQLYFSCTTRRAFMCWESTAYMTEWQESNEHKEQIQGGKRPSPGRFWMRIMRMHRKDWRMEQTPLSNNLESIFHYLDRRTRYWIHLLGENVADGLVGKLVAGRSSSSSSSGKGPRCGYVIGCVEDGGVVRNAISIFQFQFQINILVMYFALPIHKIQQHTSYII